MSIHPAQQLVLRIAIVLFLTGSGLGPQPEPALAADGVVGTGTPVSCSEAAFNSVLSAVQASGNGTITFNCGPAAHTIVFTSPKAINSAVSLDGAGRITLSGGDTTALFTVNFGDSLTLRGLTLTRSGGAGAAIGNFGRLDVIDSQLTNNAATNGSGGAVSSIGTAALTNTLVISNTAGQNGGGIYNAGTMTISGGQVSGNQATTTGGGVYNAGALTITGGLISGNRATTNGGGIYTISAVTMTQSSLANNTSSAIGGGLYGEGGSTWISTGVIQANSAVSGGGGVAHVGGALTIDQVLVANNQTTLQYGGGVLLSGSDGVFGVFAVTLRHNQARGGGGIAQSGGSLTVRNSTLSENSALVGGGFFLGGGATSIQYVTIYGNAADHVDPALALGGGIYRTAGVLDLRSSLLSSNFRSVNGFFANCFGVNGAATVLNLSNDATCAFGVGRDNVALPLGPLQNNGGFTPTHLLPQGSPAIDAGTNTGCPAVDQRGQARPVGATCDVGAVEARASDFITRLLLPTLLK